MKEKIENIKFNLTPEMLKILIQFNKINKKYNSLIEEYDLTGNEELMLKIKELLKKKDESRELFIKQFQLNNRAEIKKYLQIKHEDSQR